MGISSVILPIKTFEYIYYWKFQARIMCLTFEKSTEKYEAHKLRRMFSRNTIRNVLAFFDILGKWLCECPTASPPDIYICQAPNFNIWKI